MNNESLSKFKWRWYAQEHARVRRLNTLRYFITRFGLFSFSFFDLSTIFQLAEAHIWTAHARKHIFSFLHMITCSHCRHIAPISSSWSHRTRCRLFSYSPILNWLNCLQRTVACGRDTTGHWAFTNAPNVRCVLARFLCTFIWTMHMCGHMLLLLPRAPAFYLSTIALTKSRSFGVMTQWMQTQHNYTSSDATIFGRGSQTLNVLESITWISNIFAVFTVSFATQIRAKNSYICWPIYIVFTQMRVWKHA